MGPERTELIARLEELDRALEAAVAELQASLASNREFRKGVASAQPLPEVFSALSVPDNRASLADRLKQLEQERHRTRTAVFAVGLAEGLSIGDLGRIYGFSRQLAQRFAREARDSSGESGSGHA